MYRYILMWICTQTFRIYNIFNKEYAVVSLYNRYQFKSNWRILNDIHTAKVKKPLWWGERGEQSHEHFSILLVNTSIKKYDPFDKKDLNWMKLTFKKFWICLCMNKLWENIMHFEYFHKKRMHRMHLIYEKFRLC